MSLKLYDYQIDAINKMKNGCILNGGVGSGKSLTALGYYYLTQGGEPSFLVGGDYMPMDDVEIKNLYIITTARKRDTLEWESELARFLLAPNEYPLYTNNVVIDSWNNIGKYSEVSGAFFIFDEQRVVGSGAWVKAFLKIAKGNDWILLSATPGDSWQDYIPVFLANGFYKNKTQFVNDHVIYSRFSKFPQIDRYVNTGRLVRLRNRILIDMDFKRTTVPHHEDIYCSYDTITYKEVMKSRWNIYKDGPIEQAAELCHVLRRIVNSDRSREESIIDIFNKHPRIIIFYNFDYELDILKSINYGDDVVITEWNGHKHQPVPNRVENGGLTNGSWIYLVQYTAGCEAWNCITTDTIIFYSQNYSYKVTEQSCGRIDRLNTPYKDLYYYHLKSRSGIDIAISKALRDKKKFNEGKFVKWDAKP